MARVRLGVVLLVPGPVDVEIDGLRRALGAPALGRISPHITLVPPVNVAEERVDDAVDVVRSAAASSRPLRLTLGPPATFLPVNPVLYLAVGGDVDDVAALRTRLFVPPLERSVDRPFVPHVTLADGIDPDRVAAGVACLSSFEAAVDVERVHVLVHRPDRGWEPLADAPLAPAAIVGRGGLPTELTVTDRPDPETARLHPGRPFTVTARRDGRPVGWATGTSMGTTAHLQELIVVETQRGEGVGARLLAAVELLSAERGCDEVVAIPHPFLERHGWVGGRRRVGGA